MRCIRCVKDVPTGFYTAKRGLSRIAALARDRVVAVAFQSWSARHGVGACQRQAAGMQGCSDTALIGAGAAAAGVKGAGAARNAAIAIHKGRSSSEASISVDIGPGAGGSAQQAAAAAAAGGLTAAAGRLDSSSSSSSSRRRVHLEEEGEEHGPLGGPVQLRAAHGGIQRPASTIQSENDRVS
jgi:hypothetical protein